MLYDKRRWKDSFTWSTMYLSIYAFYLPLLLHICKIVQCGHIKIMQIILDLLLLRFWQDNREKINANIYAFCIHSIYSWICKSLYFLYFHYHELEHIISLSYYNIHFRYILSWTGYKCIMIEHKEPNTYHKFFWAITIHYN